MSETMEPYGQNGRVPDKDTFSIGVDAQDPEMMMISIPVGKYASMGEDGLDMFYGKMRRAEAVGAKIIREKIVALRGRKGIITPQIAN